MTAQHLMCNSISNSTQQAYRRSWRLFMSFTTSFHLPLSFPVSEQLLSRFIAFLVERKYSPSSVMAAVSAISFIHQLMNWVDPAQRSSIKKLVKGHRRLATTLDARLPITLPILHGLIGASNITITDSYNRALFQAMCLLAFHALLRVGEMTSSCNNLQLADIHLSHNTVGIQFKNYKHKAGSQAARHIINASPDASLCPVRTISRYISWRGSMQGPLFRHKDGTSVTRKQFSDLLKSALTFSGQQAERFNTHSFRIGGTTHMAQEGSSDSQIRLAGRWASNAFQAYTRIHNI